MTSFKMGRKRPAPYRKLHFAAYAEPSLPAPPDFVHRGKAALPCLENIYANDTLGDCTAAGAGHGLGVWRGNAGNGDPFPTTDEVVKFYSETTGYDPSNPATDQGGDEVTVLNYWRNTGMMVGGQRSRIDAWCNVDATNPLQVRQALWLAEFLYFAVELPDTLTSHMQDLKNGDTFPDGTPNPQSGHCFISASYDANLIIDTWAIFMKMPLDMVAKFAAPSAGGELHACFSQESINRASQKTDSGFDFATLLADSKALAAN